ncbi:MAG: hypothetical protein IT559_02060 [Alphaproteobacteria bacterium]|nr:hypothetical protein [Alphaproteobacteria bacterium]
MSEEMSDADYPACTVDCAKAGCGKKCCKTATPAHSAYGTHYCSDHK